MVVYGVPAPMVPSDAIPPVTTPDVTRSRTSTSSFDEVAGQIDELSHRPDLAD